MTEHRGTIQYLPFVSDETFHFQVPLGFWLQRAFKLRRNHYDRIGHFFQGFVPAILVREVLLRKKVVKPGGFWLASIVVAICLAFSAYYELIEWWICSYVEQLVRIEKTHFSCLPDVDVVCGRPLAVFYFFFIFLLLFSSAGSLTNWAVTQTGTLWDRRETSSTRSGTCCWRYWAPALPCWLWATRMTAKWRAWL